MADVRAVRDGRSGSCPLAKEDPRRIRGSRDSGGTLPAVFHRGPPPCRRTRRRAHRL